MRLLKELPFACMLDGDRLACVIWQTEPDEPACECGDGELGACDTSGISYGTSSPHEPMFCARHFYQVAVAGDGVTNYTLVERTADSAA